MRLDAKQILPWLVIVILWITIQSGILATRNAEDVRLGITMYLNDGFLDEYKRVVINALINDGYVTNFTLFTAINNISRFLLDFKGFFATILLTFILWRKQNRYRWLSKFSNTPFSIIMWKTLVMMGAIIIYILSLLFNYYIAFLILKRSVSVEITAVLNDLSFNFEISIMSIFSYFLTFLLIFGVIMLFMLLNFKQKVIMFVIGLPSSWFISLISILLPTYISTIFFIAGIFLTYILSLRILKTEVHMMEDVQ